MVAWEAEVALEAEVELVGDRVGERDGPVLALDPDVFEFFEGAGRVLGGRVPGLVD